MVGYSYLILLISSFYMIWSLFMLYSMLGMVMMKLYNTPSHSIILYFFVQEISGILFMYGFSYIVQSLLLLVKGGFSPFHGWMSYLVKFSNSKSLLWMLSWQKLPMFLLMFMMINHVLSGFLVLFSIFPLIQALYSSYLKYILFLLLTSSGNNMLVLGFYIPFYSLFLILFYLYMMYNLPGDITNSGDISLTLETFIFLFGFPGSIPFYVKLIMIYLFSSGGSLLLIIFMLGMMLNVILMLNFMESYFIFLPNVNKYFLFMVFFMVILVFI